MLPQSGLLLYHVVTLTALSLTMATLCPKQNNLIGRCCYNDRASTKHEPWHECSVTNCLVFQRKTPSTNLRTVFCIAVLTVSDTQQLSCVWKASPSAPWSPVNLWREQDTHGICSLRYSVIMQSCYLSAKKSPFNTTGIRLVHYDFVLLFKYEMAVYSSSSILCITASFPIACDVLFLRCCVNAVVSDFMAGMNHLWHEIQRE